MTLPPLPNKATPKVAADTPLPVTRNGSRVYMYMIRVRLNAGDTSGWVVVEHDELFDSDRMKAMLDDVVNVINNSRLPNRRAQLAKSRTPVGETRQEHINFNERWFNTDVDFFETVLWDKYGFRRVKPAVMECSINGTILFENETPTVE